MNEKMIHLNEENRRLQLLVNKKRIAVICVTYNRLAMLMRLLENYTNQASFIDGLYVVNNASTDGTKDYLDCWKSANASMFRINIKHMDSNLGGSGGFAYAAGMVTEEISMYDFVYFADDDAFPEPNLFAKFGLKEYSNEASAICAKVINNGTIDLLHRRNLFLKGLRIVERIVPAEYYQSQFEINAYSFVGVFVRAECLRTELPKNNLFIHYDDTEHALRIHKLGRILCDPELIVNHNTADSGDLTGWKLYYNIRNKIYTCYCHFPIYALPLTVGHTLYFNIKNRAFRPKAIPHLVLIFRAVFDGVTGRLGIHRKYYPGSVI